MCKKYAVKICRNMQFYMQHTQKSTCCIFCIYSTPHGGEGPVEKPSLSATIFSVFSTSQGKTVAKPPFLSPLRQSYTVTMSIITPMRQVRTFGRVRAPDPTLSAPKQWKSDVHVKS